MAGLLPASVDRQADTPRHGCASDHTPHSPEKLLSCESLQQWGSQWPLMSPVTASLETSVGPWEKGLFGLRPLTQYVVEGDLEFLLPLPLLPSVRMTAMLSL